jgi:predicted O-methyltransferase YrrM
MVPEEFSPELLGRIDEYVQERYVPADAALEHVREAMTAHQLPSISVTRAEGRLLYLLARLAGARRVLEIGTLGGYSAACFARAVAPTGRVITLEADPRHAAAARQSLAQAGLAALVEVREGDGLHSMQAMTAGGEGPFDLIFIDANKDGYPAYLEAAMGLAHPGTLILADNVIRNGAILRPPGAGSDLAAVQQFNQAIATDPRLESLILPLLGRGFVDGLSLSIVK